MNAFDRLQYYENFYDSFCSEFAIPRAHTSHSDYSRPSSAHNHYSKNNHQRFNGRNDNNGKFSNNVYYFDTFSDAFATPQQEEDQSHHIKHFPFNSLNSTPHFYHEYSRNNPLNELNEFVPHQQDHTLDLNQPYCSLALLQAPLLLKTRGPTPPPKPLKLKQIQDYHPPPPPPADDYSPSIPDFFQEMDSTSRHLMAIPNAADLDFGSGGVGRYFHQSFESIASCPVPPPPKCIQAPTSRHMSVERMLPYKTTYDNSTNLGRGDQNQHQKFSRSQHQHHHDRRSEPMSLSDFLKLTSNTVFKKPPFGNKKQSSPSLLPCGHLNNGSENATSSASPTPSLSSTGEGDPARGNGDGSRHSVLTFRKKCGVTKRRKKIDESLFEPTRSAIGSIELLTTSSQNNKSAKNSGSNHQNNSANSVYPFNDNCSTSHNAIIAADSSHYSITNAAAAPSPTHSIMMMAETNHDTDFELDPLPEKDCDDVLDFSWTLSPVTASDEVEADNGGGKKQSRRKPSNSSTTGGNARPSSRCSLIINSLMGHLSGLTKTTQDQPHENHHQYSTTNDNSNNNNNFAHLLDHRHNHHDDHHHQNPQEEYDDHHHDHNPPSSKKFDRDGKANKKKGKEKRTSSISDSFTAVTSNNNSHNNHVNPRSRGDLHPNGNDYSEEGSQLKQRNKRDQHQQRLSSSSDMLLMTTKSGMSSSVKENTHHYPQRYQNRRNTTASFPLIPQETDAQLHFMESSATANIRRRPRSIAAFNLDIDAILPFDDDHQQHEPRKNTSYYEGHHGSKYGKNVNFAHNNNENGTHFARHHQTQDDSFPGLGNVIGCIPRVSLSNLKTKHELVQQQQQQHRYDAFNHHQRQVIKPEFVIGGTNTTGCNNSHHHHQHSADQHHQTFQESNATDLCSNNNSMFMTPAAEVTQRAQQRQRTCSGLFCADDDCSDVDKYDRYYGQYSLTGLNIPMLASASSSSTTQPQNNILTAAKSAEELVLDRYYAHCNKIVRSKHPPSLPQPQLGKDSKKQTKKNKCSSSIFSKGKRTYSLPEKIWKNVSLPLISSANNSNNNNSKSSLLCDHHKAKQIEECFYCINEAQQRTPFNQHKSSATPGKSCGRRRRKTIDSLFQLETPNESYNHHHHHHLGRNAHVRDLLSNSKGQRSAEEEHERKGRVIKLKKLPFGGVGSNHVSTEQKDKNMKKFFHQKQTSLSDQEAIGELSSSSLSTLYTTTAAVSVHNHNNSHRLNSGALLKKNKKQRKHSSGCLNNSLTSTSEDDSCDEDQGRRTATTVAATSLKGMGVNSRRKSLSYDNFIRAEAVDDDDYDTDVGQGQLTVKVKTSALSKANNNNRISAAGELRRRYFSSNGGSNRNHNSFGARVPRASSSIINGCEPKDDDNDGEEENDGVIQVKSSRENTTVHLSKVKRNKSGRGGGDIISEVAMNPIISTANEDVIIEDSSGSSTISSLPTSPTSSSFRHCRDPDHIIDVAKEKEKEKKTGGGNTKNRVKWTFLTSGLAKATRKLSSGSSRSSLSSFTTSSDSGASSRSTGSSSHSSKKESSENTSTSSSCASSGIEVGRKSAKSKSLSSSNVLKTTIVQKHGGGRNEDADDIVNDDALKGKVKTSSKPSHVKGTDTKRRNTAEVFFHDGTGKTRISTSNATSLAFPHQQQQRSNSSILAVPNRTASLRRRPSYNTKRLRPFTAQPAPASSIRKKPMSLGQADVISSTTAPAVFLRKPVRFPHLTRVVSAPVDSKSLNRNNGIFSAFSNTSCNSCGSGSNKSSTSGYTSNVSRRTSKFLKSFRKRWAKKNNKVADGDEEDAACRSNKQNKDDDDENDDDGDDVKDDDNTKNDNNHCHYQAHHEKAPKNDTATTPFSGAVNRLSLLRRKQRNTIRASKHAVFSTFYIGPAIKDPMEEEKIYVTKDFDDVTLDLQSGEVKKTCDGTILFTADPLCFAAKNKLKKKSKKLKLKMEKQIMGKRQEEKQKKLEKVHEKKTSKDDKKNGKSISGSNGNLNSREKSRGGGSGGQMDSNKKNNNAISHVHQMRKGRKNESDDDDDDQEETVVINSSRKSRDNANSAECNNNNTKKKNSKGESYYPQKKGGDDNRERKGNEGRIGKSCGPTTAMMMTVATSAPSGKSHRVSVGTTGLIKRISKEFLVGGGTSGKNQSADDISGSGAGDENIPDTPTRGSSGILGRLRDSSRSGFGFSTSGSGNGGASSRSSSKKRSSSKHDTVNTTGGGFEVSQTDSPSSSQKNRNSLSDSMGARGNTDDANDQEGIGVSTKLSTGHNQHPSCSSEEELTSINSCDNRLSSLTIASGGEGEYNGPFQGRAVALVDYTPSPYDRHALRFKKGDVIDIISKKQTGLWTGKVNKQIGSFKFINVKLLQNPSTSSAENYDVDGNERRVGVEADEEDDVEDDIIDGDDSVGDYADPSNYQCSLHYNGRGNNGKAAAGVGEECCCPPPSSKRQNDPHHNQNPGAGTTQYRGNSKRLAGALNPWDVAAVEQRQSVANVINGYGIGGNKDKRSKEQGMYHGDPLGIMNADEEDENEEERDDVENDEEIVDEDEELGESEDDESAEAGNGEGMPNQSQLADKDVKCQKRSQKSKNKSNRAKNGGDNKDSNQENDASGNVKALPGRRQNKQGSSNGMGQPKTVGDLLQRINLEQYTDDLEKHGFESLDLLKELEEEDLDAIGIGDGADRTKILTAVELLREWDVDTDRIPGQTYYQYRYYLTTQKTPKAARGVTAGAGGAQTLGPNASNMSNRVMSQQQQQQPGSPAQIQQPGQTTTTNTGMPSPHFYRLHHPRDSGIFVGKVDGEEDGDEPISGADLSCAESHPDAETEEIILSPINLQKTSSTAVGVGGGGGATSANPNATWHSNHHHNNNNKQGSHHHINRFISKGAPAGIVPTSNKTSNSAATGGPGAIQIAQQPTSSASSSGSSSSSSGIATTGESFWNSVSSSNNSNGSGGSSASSGGGATTSSIVVDQNHTQWTKQQQQTRDHQHHPSSSGGNTHHRKRDASPAYNTDSVRNRFLQAKSLFETSNNCSGDGNSAAAGGKPTRTPSHVYENGGAVLDENVSVSAGIMESQAHHLHLQRVGSQGKSLAQQQQQQQNRFLYCEKSSDSGISVCTNSPPPLRNEFRN